MRLRARGRPSEASGTLRRRVDAQLVAPRPASTPVAGSHPDARPSTETRGALMEVTVGYGLRKSPAELLRRSLRVVNRCAGCTRPAHAEAIAASDARHDQARLGLRGSARRAEWRIGQRRIGLDLALRR